MERLKTLFNQYFWLIVMVWLALIAAGVFWLSGKYQENKTEGEINQTRTESKKAVGEATNAENQAANSSQERRTEDAIREKTIKPKLESSRRQSQNSKIELEKAKQQYNETSQTIHNSNASRTSNCAELKSLFPNAQFEYCQ